jgi:hypothetical protein
MIIRDLRLPRISDVFPEFLSAAYPLLTRLLTDLTIMAKLNKRNVDDLSAQMVEKRSFGMTSFSASTFG